MTVKRAVPRLQVFPVGESMTKQSFKDECDVNLIMKRYQKTGVLPMVSNRQPRYEDFGTGLDFHEAMQHVVAAQEMFNSLPSSVRSRFGNDAGAFLDFVQNPENVEEMRKMGLLSSKEPPQADDKPQPAKQAAATNGSNEPTDGVADKK